MMTEEVTKRSNVGERARTGLFVLGFYAVVNMPYAVHTFNLPKEQIQPTISQQLRAEESKLFDILGGCVYTNFMFLGTCMGYAAREVFN